MVTTIKKMYEMFKFKFKKGDKTVMIDYLIGMHQCDKISTLLFVLVFQAAMESLELTEKRKATTIPSYRFFLTRQMGNR